MPTPTTFSLIRDFAGHITRGHRLAFIEWLRNVRDRGRQASTAEANLWLSKSDLRAGDFKDYFNQVIDLLAEAFTVSLLAVCESCGQLVWEADANTSASDESVCDSCWDNNYRSCDACGEYYPDGDMYSIIHYGDLCDSCLHNGDVEWAACADCGDKFLVSEMMEVNDEWYCDNHAPRATSMCEPKFLDFVFPALCTPEKEVKAEAIATITVTSGDISQIGIQQIINHVYRSTRGRYGSYEGVHLSELLQENVLDRTWQTKEGNLPKRLAKHLLIERHMKLTEEMMAEIGNLAKQYTTMAGTHYLSLTRNINQPKEEFVNDGSCWWNEYTYSRCELKAWYGFGVRTWASADGHKPISRAWMVPLKVTVGSGYPRFSESPDLPADAYVLFNAYGIEQLPYARMIAGMTGKSYKKLTDFHMRAYINAGGILIAEQSVCDATDAIELRQHYTCTGRCK